MWAWANKSSLQSLQPGAQERFVWHFICFNQCSNVWFNIWLGVWPFLELLFQVLTLGHLFTQLTTFPWFSRWRCQRVFWHWLTSLLKTDTGRFVHISFGRRFIGQGLLIEWFDWFPLGSLSGFLWSLRRALGRPLLGVTLDNRLLRRRCLRRLFLLQFHWGSLWGHLGRFHGGSLWGHLGRLHRGSLGRRSWQRSRWLPLQQGQRAGGWFIIIFSPRKLLLGGGSGTPHTRRWPWLSHLSDACKQVTDSSILTQWLITNLKNIDIGIPIGMWNLPSKKKDWGIFCCHGSLGVCFRLAASFWRRQAKPSNLRTDQASK